MDHIYAVGVGGANIDLCGRSYAPIEPRKEFIEQNAKYVVNLDI